MLTTKQLAKELGVSVITIYSWKQKGLPTHKTFKGIREINGYDLDEVKQWVAEKRHASK